jgi:oligosaccharyl transferase (archaeosortase A-associated)
MLRFLAQAQWYYKRKERGTKLSESRSSSRWLIVILLVVIFGVALCIRVVPSYSTVFAGDNVKFTTNDAYYFVRQVDNLVNHFPHFSSFEPYLNYPTGLPLGPMNFFVFLLGGITWLFGMGSPSAHMVDILCAYLPAILGALTVIPVYFIGKTLFNRGVGIVAAALIAILPGEFLGRTLLGVADRDCLEILLTTLTMLFIILAVKSAREKQLTFRRLNRQNLSGFTKPIIYSLLSGILLGLSILTWRGSFLFVLVFFVYFVIQSIVDYIEEESFDYISFVGSVTFFAAFLIVGPISRSQLYSVALAISLLIPLVFSGLAWLLMRRRAKSLYYVMSVIGIGLVGIGILYAASPSLFKSILDQFSVFIPSGASATITEMGSILFPGGYFTLNVVWLNYTLCLYISIIALGLLIYLSFKRSKIEDMFIIVWSLILLWATLDIRRIAPFFAITVALLSGYMAVIIYYSIQFVINRLVKRSNYYVTSQLGLLTDLSVHAMPDTTETETPQEVDYYQVLGVPRGASHKQIKKAHAKLIFKYRNSNDLTDKDKASLSQIDRVYSMLSDQQNRAAYDHSMPSPVTPQQASSVASKKPRFQMARVLIMVVAGLAIFFLVLFPNISPAASTIDEAKTFAPSDAWSSSLTWLKNNTPEPFGDSTFYYNLYQTPINYPASAYTVAAWWDFGYWILRTGHRLPSCDPGGGARESVARLIMSQNEITADELANNLNSKYVIIDDATVTEMYYAIATYAGTNSNQFIDTYYMPDNGRLKAVPFYYPQYYQSLAVRLYTFNGNEIVPDSISVISYEEKVTNDGFRYKLITDSKTFTSYEAAADYIANQTSGNYRIASPNPLVSIVPLGRLGHYKLVYSSDQFSSIFLGGKIPAVKIFEYTQ